MANTVLVKKGATALPPPESIEISDFTKVIVDSTSSLEEYTSTSDSSEESADNENQVADIEVGYDSGPSSEKRNYHFSPRQ